MCFCCTIDSRRERTSTILPYGRTLVLTRESLAISWIAVIPYNTILTYQIGSHVTERKRAREARREKQRDRERICLPYPASQSCSVWSRGRYLIPRLSSSASTSSGIRPLTRTAYIPRTYFAMESGQNWWPRSKGKT